MVVVVIGVVKVVVVVGVVVVVVVIGVEDVVTVMVETELGDNEVVVDDSASDILSIFISSNPNFVLTLLFAWFRINCTSI